MRRFIKHYGTIFRVVIPYLVFASAWILVSDQAVMDLARGNQRILTQLQDQKGIAFVLTSGLLIFGLLLADLRRKERGDAQHQIEIQTYISQLKQINFDLENSHEAIIRGWALALEMRDLETSGHSLRTCAMLEYLMSYMGLAQDTWRDIRWGALLHDIGKIGIPDSILLKPGPLTKEERLIMEKHPIYGKQFLESTPYLRASLSIPYYHHERWDGSGYPCGLIGENIPVEARLFAVIDVADAMSSDRPYRKKFSVEAIYDHLNEESGRLYDPQVVQAFVSQDVLRRNPSWAILK